MQKSAIRNIFYGETGYNETAKIPKKNEKRIDKICDLEKELKNKLSPELFELHQKFIKLLEEDCCDEVEYYYGEGFKLGLRIGIESMESK